MGQTGRIHDKSFPNGFNVTPSNLQSALSTEETCGAPSSKLLRLSR